jgi:hypothetical protein
MESTNHIFNSTEDQPIAGQTVRNDKRDRPSFRYYTQNSDTEFPISSEKKINTLYPNSLQASENETTKNDEKIKIIISRFNPLLDLSEAFLRRNHHNIVNLQVMNFSLKELRNALDRKCLWEIRRNCLKIISELERHIDEFIDKGCLSIILSNFNLLIRKLSDDECELADAINHQDMKAD